MIQKLAKEGEQGCPDGLADIRGCIPRLEHQTDIHKRMSKVPAGFSFRSMYEVAIEPIEKKYKQKNLYRPED